MRNILYCFKKFKNRPYSTKRIQIYLYINSCSITNTPKLPSVWRVPKRLSARARTFYSWLLQDNSQARPACELRLWWRKLALASWSCSCFSKLRKPQKIILKSILGPPGISIPPCARWAEPPSSCSTPSICSPPTSSRSKPQRSSSSRSSSPEQQQQQTT